LLGFFALVLITHHILADVAMQYIVACLHAVQKCIFTFLHYSTKLENPDETQ
jgi:hypothetical protein